MRSLTPQQKKILDAQPDTVYMYDMLDDEVLAKVIALNDYETVYHDIDRYLGEINNPHVRRNR
jgi:hypothetical protein